MSSRTLPFPAVSAHESDMSAAPLRVLFLCTGNAARSQMAEALLRHFSKAHAQVFSAGSAPEAQLHPMARATLEDKYGIDTSAMHPKSMTQFLDKEFDFVITVCDRVSEKCPVFPNDPEHIHWSFEDPTSVKEPAAQERAFDHVATGIAGRLRIWMALPTIRARLGLDAK